MVLSKWATSTSSMANFSRISHCRSVMVLMSGTGWWKTRVSGWVSKVRAAAEMPRLSARFRARVKRAAWPRWTPSKKPRAMTRS